MAQRHSHWDNQQVGTTIHRANRHTACSLGSEVISHLLSDD